MLKKRIIPCLDIKDGRTVKGINFVDYETRNHSGCSRLASQIGPKTGQKAFNKNGAKQRCQTNL